jgi:ComF family protein
MYVEHSPRSPLPPPLAGRKRRRMDDTGRMPGTAVVSAAYRKRIQLTARGIHSLDRIVAATTYHHSPLLKKAIHTFKYQQIAAFAQPLGTLLVHASPMLSAPADAVLCPVPLHWSRRFGRGFNQSKLLAQEVAKQHGWAVRELLKRKRPTGHQAHRGRVERWDALSGAFEVRQGALPTHVILIDDVTTTGATLEMCARTLRKAGVTTVQGLVLAQG